MDLSPEIKLLAIEQVAKLFYVMSSVISWNG